MGAATFPLGGEPEGAVHARTIEANKRTANNADIINKTNRNERVTFTHVIIMHQIKCRRVQIMRAVDNRAAVAVIRKSEQAFFKKLKKEPAHDLDGNARSEAGC